MTISVLVRDKVDLCDCLDVLLEDFLDDMMPVRCKCKVKCGLARRWNLSSVGMQVCM